MICYSTILLALGFVSALPSQNLHPLSDEFIAEINNKQLTWKAGRNFEIEEYELFKVLANGVKKRSVPIAHKNIHIEDDNIPESFDAREAWPDCADIIGLIQDQSRCGSSWVFASVEAMSDRICIHSNATRKVLVSAQAALSCSSGQGGCAGGDWTIWAWIDWRDKGIVTGGLYNNIEQGCQSYFLPTCDDQPNSCTDYVDTNDTPGCSTKCDDPSLDYTAQKTYGGNFVQIAGETQIQLEILTNGPVVTSMNLYCDFASYKSGIYQKHSGFLAGVHAVKIIGWGVEDGTKYWLAINSWNERWGENGFFRIIRGQNEVDIETDVYAALPDFSRF